MRIALTNFPTHINIEFHDRVKKGSDTLIKAMGSSYTIKNDLVYYFTYLHYSKKWNKSCFILFYMLGVRAVPSF